MHTYKQALPPTPLYTHKHGPHPLPCKGLTAVEGLLTTQITPRMHPKTAQYWEVTQAHLSFSCRNTPSSLCLSLLLLPPSLTLTLSKMFHSQCHSYTLIHSVGGVLTVQSFSPLTLCRSPGCHLSKWLPASPRSLISQKASPEWKDWVMSLLYFQEQVIPVRKVYCHCAISVKVYDVSKGSRIASVLSVNVNHYVCILWVKTLGPSTALESL